MKRTHVLFSFVGFIVITISMGCAHTRTIDAKVNVMRKPKGQALAVSSSSSEAIAWDGAKVRAEEHCFKSGKDYVVLKEKSNYQGADKTAKGIAGAVGSFFGKGTSGGNLDDYKVMILFQCEGSYTGNGEPFAKTLDLSSGSSGYRGTAGRRR